MNLLPLEFVFILRTALVEPMADGEDAEAVEVIGDAEYTTDNIVGRGAIVETATAHLYPTRTQAKLFGLILHGNGGYRGIFYPTVVLHGIAQYGYSYRGALKELRAHVLGIAEFLEVHRIVDHNEMPGALTLRRGRHKGCTEYELEMLRIDLLGRELAMAATLLRQIFEISHNCYTLLLFCCKNTKKLRIKNDELRKK